MIVTKVAVNGMSLVYLSKSIYGKAKVDNSPFVWVELMDIKCCCTLEL